MVPQIISDCHSLCKNSLAQNDSPKLQFFLSFPPPTKPQSSSRWRSEALWARPARRPEGHAVLFDALLGLLHEGAKAFWKLRDFVKMLMFGVHDQAKLGDYQDVLSRHSSTSQSLRSLFRVLGVYEMHHPSSSHVSLTMCFKLLPKTVCFFTNYVVILYIDVAWVKEGLALL